MAKLDWVNMYTVETLLLAFREVVFSKTFEGLFLSNFSTLLPESYLEIMKMIMELYAKNVIFKAMEYYAFTGRAG